jgi:hypothetical protein
MHTDRTVIEEPSEEYNWQNPSRTAIQEEIAKLIQDMEKDQGAYSGEQLLSLIKQEL